MTRSSDLPDFKAPPVSEVVLGVQYQPLQALSAYHYGLFWQEIQHRYKSCRDVPPLAATFETFGRRVVQANEAFMMDVGVVLPRQWFLSEEGDHLCQLQSNRLLHNWRSQDGSESYPRYETVRAAFAEDLNAFSVFSEKQALGSIVVNQAEITYVNVITSAVTGDGSSVHNHLGQVFRFWQDDEADDCIPALESTSFRMTAVVKNEQEPLGRLYVKCDPVVHASTGLDALKVELTFRGTPNSEKISDALDFLDLGRKKIVKTFAAITTNRMHEIWGRTA